MAATDYNFGVSTNALKVPCQEFMGRKVKLLFIECSAVLLSPVSLQHIEMESLVLVLRTQSWVLPSRLKSVFS